MPVQRVVPIGFCALLVAATVFAGSNPTAVSPGDPSQVVVIGGACPTFSWGRVAGARYYELVVYRLGDEGEEVEPALIQRVSGSALAWTPDLNRCLEPGRQYAWSVRAEGEGESSEWSAPNLFEVASGPSEMEFRAAVEVVRSYLKSGARHAMEAATTSDSSPGERPAYRKPRSPLAPPPGTELTVDGNVDATSFSGDGAMVTDLDPTQLSGAVSLDKGGTGATDAAGARSNLDVAQGAHTVDTNAGTLCAAGTLLNGDGTCDPIPIDTDTNAATLCAAGQFLNGDGTCDPIPVTYPLVTTTGVTDSTGGAVMFSESTHDIIMEHNAPGNDVHVESTTAVYFAVSMDSGDGSPVTGKTLAAGTRFTKHMSGAGRRMTIEVHSVNGTSRFRYVCTQYNDEDLVFCRQEAY